VALCIEKLTITTKMKVTKVRAEP